MGRWPNQLHCLRNLIGQCFYGAWSFLATLDYLPPRGFLKNDIPSEQGVRWLLGLNATDQPPMYKMPATFVFTGWFWGWGTTYWGFGRWHFYRYRDPKK